MKQNFIKILKFYAEHEGEYFSPKEIPVSVKIDFKDYDLYNLIGAKYKSLFTEDKTRTHYYKINENGIAVLNEHDNSWKKYHSGGYSFEEASRLFKESLERLPAENPNNHPVSPATKPDAKSGKILKLTNNALIAAIIGGFIVAIICHYVFGTP